MFAFGSDFLLPKMASPPDFPYLTKQVVFMGLIYAIGGLVYGYDTGTNAVLSHIYKAY